MVSCGLSVVSCKVYPVFVIQEIIERIVKSPLLNLSLPCILYWVHHPLYVIDFFVKHVYRFVWNFTWLEQWADWTSNIEGPTSNVQYGWRCALSNFKPINRTILKPRPLCSVFFKLTEFIIRCWTFNVRCSTFIRFFSDQTGCPLASGRRSYETSLCKYGLFGF